MNLCLYYCLSYPAWKAHVYFIVSSGLSGCRVQQKCDGARAETRFLLTPKRTSPFKSAGGRQFSQLLAADVCVSAVVMVVMLDTPCSEVV